MAVDRPPLYDPADPRTGRQRHPGGVVDISWLGHACIRLRTLQTSVVMDPCDRSSGFDMGRPNADVVTVSHPDPAHAFVRGVRGEPFMIDGPGEYEIKGVQLTGIATYLTPPAEGRAPQRNTAYLLEAEELRLVHLGGLGAPLTAGQSELLANIDILVLPIGGDGALTPEQAARTVRALEPAVVIPVHFPWPKGPRDDGPLKQFITNMGVEPEPAAARLSIQRRALTEMLRLVLLEPRG
ncbi:MAG: Zn-dependent hydrolase [Dehalococcoidia bacterium]|nr:Zn-dependent hydrolase [Dehalococcoidia bacterium]